MTNFDNTNTTKKTKAADKSHNLDIGLHANQQIEHSSDAPSAAQYDHHRPECAHWDYVENPP